MWCTKIDYNVTLSGSISPGLTTSYASQIVQLLAVATSGLLFAAVRLKVQFPSSSALAALINAKSANID